LEKEQNGRKSSQEKVSETDCAFMEEKVLHFLQKSPKSVSVKELIKALCHRRKKPKGLFLCLKQLACERKNS